jgi:para-nitrobenzyl esterase
MVKEVPSRTNGRLLGRTGLPGVALAIQSKTNQAIVFNMNRIIASIAFLLLLASEQVFPNTVNTVEGPVTADTENGTEVFRAIPYAAPPVGPLRWQPPQTAHSWSASLDNKQFSSVCPQRLRYPPDSPAEPTSEDCLYLNVWRPAVPVARPLPVMVWIYGGGLESGSGSTRLYHGDVLAKHGVIVVTFNYRLGVLGFLTHPGLTAESSSHTSGNYGLLDQVAALQWVQRNIAAFGGDPKNVTVFGQSSGSISISVLTTMPQARGLFQRAIGESGGLFEPLELADDFTLAGAEQDGVAFAARARRQSIAQLRELSTDALLTLPFFPHFVVDGTVLPESPYAAYQSGRNHSVDLLIGYDADDGAWALKGSTVTAESMEATLSHDFPSWLVRLIGPSRPDSDRDAYEAAAAFERDMRFGYDMTAWAQLHMAQARGATYFYRFNGLIGQPERGAHGNEMAYVFGHPPPNRSWTDAEQKLSALLGSYWTHFAAYGDPNGGDLPRWPRTTPKDGGRLEIGDASVGGPDFVPRIGRAYRAIRFCAAHGLAIVACVALLLMVLIVWVCRIIFRRRRLRGALVRDSTQGGPDFLQE